MEEKYLFQQYIQIDVAIVTYKEWWWQLDTVYAQEYL